MAKLNEIIYDIRESIKEFSDDTEIDNRHLIYLINTKRAKYLRQDLNNMQKTTDMSIQQSFCIGLVEVSAAECGISAGCETMLRTSKPLPTPIELHLSPAITKVKPAHRLGMPFTFKDKSKVIFLQHAPYGKSIYTYLDTDGYLYIVSKNDVHKLLDCISVSGIFENPLELSAFKNCCNCPEVEATCYDETKEYPLQPHYIDLIKSDIVNDLVRIKQIPEDKTNDATDLNNAR